MISDCRKFMLNIFKMLSILFSILIFFYGNTFIFPLYSKNVIESYVCKPYYVCIKSSKANVRVGPGEKYKIVATFNTKFIPVVINARYGHWRRIKDPDGLGGWVHKNFLSSKKRFVISRVELSHIYESPDSNSKIIVDLKKNVVMHLVSVKDGWCRVEFESHKKKYEGWIEMTSVFGVDRKENW